MEYSYLAIAMLVVGLVLLIAELFVPSGGLISVGMLVCMAVSVWAAYKAWWDASPWQFWFYIGSVVLLVPASLGGALFLMQRTRLGREVMINPPSLEEVTGSQEQERHLRQLIGKTGRTLNMFTPGGIVLIDGERMHAESEGMLIDAGASVQVVAIKGNRIVVREISEAAAANATERKSDAAPTAAAGDDFLASSENDAAEEPPLDFEVPQS